jgi:hypothetical protein
MWTLPHPYKLRIPDPGPASALAEIKIDPAVADAFNPVLPVMFRPAPDNDVNEPAVIVPDIFSFFLFPFSFPFSFFPFLLLLY